MEISLNLWEGSSSVEVAVVFLLAIAVAFFLKSAGVKRSTNDPAIAGVCEGIAKHFEMSPFGVRVLWVLASCIFGWGILTYIVLWAILPVEGAKK